MVADIGRDAKHGVSASRASTNGSVVSSQSRTGRYIAAAAEKSTRMPTTERLAVLATCTGVMARSSAAMRSGAIPARRNRRPTSSGSRWGRDPTSRPGTSSGRSVTALTRRISGRRSTTSRFAYQSPSAVSGGATDSADTGSARASFCVRRRVTVTAHESGEQTECLAVWCNRCWAERARSRRRAGPRLDAAELCSKRLDRDLCVVRDLRAQPVAV